MGAQGTITLNFGGFPGSSNVSVDVSQPSIAASSLAEAWLMPAATADHSIDEHVVDGPLIFAGNVQAGVGFTIYGVIRPQVSVPDGANSAFRATNSLAGVPAADNDGRKNGMCYGQWTVAWVWN
jgi:hypothetical protein